MTDLYSHDGDDIQRFEQAATQTDKLAQYEGRLASLGGAELAQIISDYQAVSERLSRVISHADLQFAADMANPKTGQHAQDVKEAISGLSARLLFVELELAAMEEDSYQQALSDPEFYHFVPCCAACVPMPCISWNPGWNKCLLNGHRPDAGPGAPV